MNAEDMFEKHQSDLAREIEEHFERQKRGPVVVRSGPNATLQDVAAATGQAALARLKNNRAYALSDEGKLKFGAICIASRAAKANLVDTLSEMAATQYVVDLEKNKWTRPNWTQTWRPAPVVIEPLPIDKITGERVRNPWLEPHDIKSQNVIRSQSPRQAKFLEDAAKNNGVTAHMLDELDFERLQSERLAAVRFSANEWNGNKLRKDLELNLTARMLFERSLEDPWMLSAYRHEAEMGSPRALLSNLTFRMCLAKKDQTLAAIHRSAAAIHAQWQADEQERKAAA